LDRTDVRKIHPAKPRSWTRRLRARRARRWHPLSIAIVQGVAERGLKLTPAEAFSNIDGKGVIARRDGRQVISGNVLFLAEHGLEADGLNKPAVELVATARRPRLLRSMERSRASSRSRIRSSLAPVR
jgi:cation transport ATPase